MKWRKFVCSSMALILVLALLFLAGCGRPSSPPAGGQETPAQSTPGGGAPSTGQPSGGAGSGSAEGLVAGIGQVKDLMEKGIAYDLVTTNPQGTTSMRIWVQGYKLKTEGTFNGQRMISILDTRTQTVITYYPDRNEAVRLAGDKPQTEAKSPGDYLKGRDFSKAQVIGSEVYDGAPCRVILVAEENGGQSKMWVREDCGLPVKVETEIPGQGKTVVEYKNLQFGPFPPDTFELPPGAKITDLTQMLNQIQQQMPRVPGAPR